MYGDVNPSGRLPETFPASASQGVAHGGTVLTPNLQFPGDGANVDYTEGIDVGYRYYDTHRQTPLFPFGYGLSYTTFSYSGLRVSPARDGAGVTITVTNTGRRAGATVPQLYLTDPTTAGEPPFQLKGFQKVSLAPRAEQAGHLLHHPPGHELLPDGNQPLGSRPWLVPGQHRQ